ncbi:uncharacterized protein LOC128629172 [Ictalurus punctatus]|uniref:Uncharacterized protein LOC128629172 n=1 Tax=Ictalurus punctatus TaxID=7998 RepID=A0A9F7QX20_ICTPU|nr:uncharacterized protein LOC128629172 [Ictalurus punctatus]
MINEIAEAIIDPVYFSPFIPLTVTCFHKLTCVISSSLLFATGPDRGILYQSAVNKADFISAFATHSNLSVLALTETWIHAKNIATPAALASDFNFSHTSRPNRRGGGTGLLLSKTWKFTCLSPSCSYTSFEFHAVTVTDPAKMHFLVVYRPPGQLGKFIDEFDTLLSTIPDDGTPLLVLGDINIHLDKPHAADFLALLPTFDLKQFTTPATHKAEQPPGHQAVWLQEQPLHGDCSAFRH